MLDNPFVAFIKTSTQYLIELISATFEVKWILRDFIKSGAPSATTPGKQSSLPQILDLEGSLAKMASQHASEQHHTDAASDKHAESFTHNKDEEDVVSQRGANEAPVNDAAEKAESATAGPGPPPVCDGSD